MYSSLLNHLRAKAGSRHLVDGLPSLGAWRTRFYIGDAHYTCASTSDRVQLKAATHWIEDYPALAPEVARAYVDIKYSGKRFRCNRVQYHQAVKERPPAPLYARPNIHPEHLVYLDIRSAYWQILCSCGYDVDYQRGTFLGVNSSCDDFPFPAWKLARNSIVSVGLNRSVAVYDNGRIYSVKVGNARTNYVLWMFVQDVLHGVACDAVAAGALYCHTDGYICRRRDFDNVYSAVRGWGLDVAVKWEGYGWVRGPGAYLIASKKSGLYDRITPRAFSNLYDPQVNFLRSRFRAWREKWQA